MAISVECECGKRYRVADAAAGKRFSCKQCGTKIKVPGPTRKPRKAKSSPKPQAARAANGEDDFLNVDLDAYEHEVVKPPRRRAAAQGLREEALDAPQTLEERIQQRTAESGEVDEEADNWPPVAGGLFLIACAVGVYFLFAYLESGEGTRFRAPIWFIAAYAFLGKEGVAAILGGLGIVSIGLGLAHRVDDDE